MIAHLQTKDAPKTRFEHKYASSSYVRFRRAEWGGLQGDTLVIVANIPLEPGADGYDEDKVVALERAVSQFVKIRHSPYAHIEFIQKDA